MWKVSWVYEKVHNIANFVAALLYYCKQCSAYDSGSVTCYSSMY